MPIIYNPLVSVVENIQTIADSLKSDYEIEGGFTFAFKSDQAFWDQAMVIYENLREAYEQSADDAREDYLCSFE